MPARKLPPSYLLHCQSGRGRLVWTESGLKRQDEILPGPIAVESGMTAEELLERVVR